MDELTDRDRWDIVRERDARYDGAFVFGVSSTGIYCRPSCPAKRPQPERVVFFAGPDEAERAGFRACRRCRPRHAEDPQLDLVRRVCRFIETHPDSAPSLADLGKEFHMSPYHLQRTFRRLAGVTPRQYAEAQRVGRLKAELRTRDTVTAAINEAGYNSSSSLYARSGDHLGMTPADYRAGGRAHQIDYTIVASPLGRLLVAATKKGVCAVYLGDRDTPLEEALRKEYPAADIRRDATDLRIWVDALLQYLGGREPRLDLPLDVQATAFQWRVWEALRSIPYGATLTYGEIAAALGQPAATRAVGHACATNPVSLVIPCHRAVRKDGGLGGYRWGLGRKEALLEMERKK
jgi:AraC family transcriptional regulator of adaptative response/methylated-DNA-[protein]-cysteine methyltransferase